MCSPTVALIVGGSVLQGTAGFLGARQEAETLEFKSKVAENEARFLDIKAEQTQEAGAIAQSQLLQETSKAVAANVASTAGSGIDIGGATAREVFESTAQVGIADVIQTQINTKRAVWGLKTGAQAKRSEAKQLKKTAKRTKLLAPLKFLAPVASGAGQLALAGSGTQTPKTRTQ